jgi:nucleoside-diphosphate-sugar epimerase
VYASSSSVYGDRVDLPTREDAPAQPMSPYGVSKLAAEHLCALYQVNYGIPALSLRYFTVYGPPNSGPIWRFTSSCGRSFSTGR